MGDVGGVGMDGLVWSKLLQLRIMKVPPAENNHDIQDYCVYDMELRVIVISRIIVPHARA